MQTEVPIAVATRPAPALLRFFRPAPARPVTLSDPAALDASLRAWQTKVLVSSIIGYATFYFVRKNLSVAMPLLKSELGIPEDQLGLILTLHGVIYGVSKFANGFLGDRCNARAFMVVGLAGSALMNLFFGFGSAVLTFGIFWMINGWFQGMGFPPCARLLTHWFPPKTFAMKMSIWNISHSVGGCLILILCGSLLAPVSWRLCFIVPAAIAVLCAVYLWFALPDTPPSVGLPEVQGTQMEHPESDTVAGFIDTVMKYVFTNKYIWLISFANFFVYILRFGVMDWGPTLLHDAKHLSISHSSWMVAGFEAAGVMGALLSGWLTDRFFGGRAMRAGVFYMIFAGVFIYLFWNVAGESKLWNTLLLCAAGFFIYGPQCLVGVAVAKLATKRAAATAVGLTGLFGYFSTILSGWGLGWLVKHYGWNAGFAGLMAVAVIGTLLFLVCWQAKADGYERPATD
jgi:OPA family glycerol-3-phosphate transporter-like MFS transporter/OPA family sugar phosphate sensor protein UhpC-like MFS transporter